MNREKLIYLIGTLIAILVLGSLTFFVYKTISGPNATVSRQDATFQQDSNSFCKRVFGYDGAELYGLTRKSTVVEITYNEVLDEFARLGIEIDKSKLPKALFNRYALVRDGVEVEIDFKGNIEAFAVGNAHGFDASSQSHLSDANISSFRNGLLYKEVTPGEDLSTQYCIKLKNGSALDVNLNWLGVVNINSAFNSQAASSITVPSENYEDDTGTKIALKALESMKLDFIKESFLFGTTDSDPLKESVVVKVDAEKNLVWIRESDLIPGLNQLIVAIEEDLYSFNIEN